MVVGVADCRLVIVMRAKRPLAFLLVAVMAVSLLAVSPAAAGGSNNDCNAYAFSGAAQNADSGSANSVANAIVDVDQTLGQLNSITNAESGGGGAVQVNVAQQTNAASQNQC